MVRNVKISNIVKINEKNLTKKDNWKYINYLDTSSITEGIIENIQKIDLSQEKAPSRAKRKVEKDDIIISTVRPNLKHYGIIKAPYDNMIVSTGFTVLTPIKEKVNPDYLYNFFRLEEVTNFLSAIAETSTTTYPSITSKVIEDLEISLPALEKQNKIASILSSLDEKIELNRKINQNLEEIAQTLFKRWFIDFEFLNEERNPYKSSGGKMIESELGEIPEGWRVGKLGELIKIQNGYAFKSKDFLNKGDIGIIKIKNISNKIIDILNTDFISNDICKEVEDKYLINNSDILIAMTGAEIGKIGIVPQSNKQLYLNQRVGKIVEIMNGGKEYSYFHLNQKKYQELIFLKSSGSAQPNISASEIENIEIILPSLDLLNKFKDLTTENFLKIVYNLGEINYLLKVRDYLLPRLMSGEISI